MAFLDCVDVHAIAAISKFDVAEAVGTGAEIDENVVWFYIWSRGLVAYVSL